jgi:hypothetical protein
VQQLGGGVFDRGDTALGRAGRRTMGTRGLTCRVDINQGTTVRWTTDRSEIRIAVRHGYNNRISK